MKCDAEARADKNRGIHVMACGGKQPLPTINPDA